MKIEGPELPPKSGNEPKQLVILLHGYGSNGDDLISLAPEFQNILPDAHFISPNAPYKCEMATPMMPSSYQWFSLLSHDPISMYEGAVGASDILNNYIDEQLSRFELSEKDLALIGFSQGTMMSLHTGLRKEKEIAGILGYSGSLLEAEPIENHIKSKPPICLIHGVVDPVVPFISMGNAEKSLKKLSVKVTTHARPMLAHGIDFEGIEIGKKFLKEIYG